MGSRVYIEMHEDYIFYAKAYIKSHNQLAKFHREMTIFDKPK